MKKSLSAALILLAIINILAVCVTTVSLAADIPAPTLSKTEVNYGNVTVYWEKIKTADKYRVYRKAEGDKSWLYEVGFDIMYAWSFPNALEKVFNGNSGAASIFDAFNNDMSNVPKGKTRMRYIINHDTASEKSPISRYGGEKGAMAAVGYDGHLCCSGRHLRYIHATGVFKVRQKKEFHFGFGCLFSRHFIRTRIH